MSHLKEDASTAIEAQIKVQQGRWRPAHEEVVEAECRMEELRELLSYAVCQKCGAELMGGIETVKGVMMEAKAAGRRDGTCPRCVGKPTAPTGKTGPGPRGVKGA